MGFLARFELRFLLARLGVALGLRAQLPGVLLGAADDFRGDAFAVGNPPGDGGHADKAGGGREDEAHGGRAHSTFYLQTATIAGLSWGR